MKTKQYLNNAQYKSVFPTELHVYELNLIFPTPKRLPIGKERTIVLLAVMSPRILLHVYHVRMHYEFAFVYPFSSFLWL